jgi:CheY-like chemotaxis protein
MTYPTQVRILLVEDEAAIREVLRIFLESLDCLVVEAQNGREGLQRYQELSIDAVISDIYMPEMNGLELIKAIHHDDPAAIIIAMSANREQLTLAHDLGAKETVSKPFDLDEWRGLLNGIRHSIGEGKFCPSQAQGVPEKVGRLAAAT